MGSIGGLGRELKEIGREMTIEVLCGEGVQEMARAVLVETDRTARRRRALDPLFMLWTVLALPLRRSLSIPNVVVSLLSGLRGRFPYLPLRPVTDGALAHARVRLGVAPVRALWRRVAGLVNPQPAFHGLRVWAVDGTHLDMPDTPENVRAFGKIQGSRGDSAFPHLRLVALLEVVSRRIRAVRFLSSRISETKAMPSLVKNLGEGDLLLADRGLYAFAVVMQLLSQGSHFLFRVSKILTIQRLQTLGKGDWIGEIKYRLPLEEVPLLPGLRVIARKRKFAYVRLRVRVIEFRVEPDGEVNRLVTSLIDPGLFPVRELALLYHRRWEIELAYDEVKTHLSRTAKGTAGTILRSKNPRLVMQEAYALVITYNLVRGLIGEAARAHDIAPEEISFVDALITIQLAIPHFSGAATERLPHLYRQLLSDLAACRNRRPRRPRSCPRVIRVKMSHFLLKRPPHIERKVDFVAATVLGSIS